MPRPRTAQFLSPLLILIGVLVTLENFQVIGAVSAHWPLLLIILGLGFLMLFYQRQRSDAVLLWLGSFLTILAFFCYYLNFFAAWSRLSWLWPFFLGIVGMSFLVLGSTTWSSTSTPMVGSGELLNAIAITHTSFFKRPD